MGNPERNSFDEVSWEVNFHRNLTERALEEAAGLIKKLGSKRFKVGMDDRRMWQNDKEVFSVKSMFAWNFNGELSNAFELIEVTGKSKTWKVAANILVLATFWGIRNQRNKRIFEDNEDSWDVVWDSVNYNIAL